MDITNSTHVPLNVLRGALRGVNSEEIDVILRQPNKQAAALPGIARIMTSTGALGLQDVSRLHTTSKSGYTSLRDEDTFLALCYHAFKDIKFRPNNTFLLKTNAGANISKFALMFMKANIPPAALKSLVNQSFKNTKSVAVLLKHVKEEENRGDLERGVFREGIMAFGAERILIVLESALAFANADCHHSLACMIVSDLLYKCDNDMYVPFFAQNGGPIPHHNIIRYLLGSHVMRDYYDYYDYYDEYFYAMLDIAITHFPEEVRHVILYPPHGYTPKTKIQLGNAIASRVIYRKVGDIHKIGIDVFETIAFDAVREISSDKDVLKLQLYSRLLCDIIYNYEHNCEPTFERDVKDELIVEGLRLCDAVDLSHTTLRTAEQFDTCLDKVLDVAIHRFPHVLHRMFVNGELQSLSQFDVLQTIQNTLNGGPPFRCHWLAVARRYNM